MGKKKTKISFFASPLDEVESNAKSVTQPGVPQPIVELVTYLRGIEAYKTEGLFRIPGNAAVINKCVQELNKSMGMKNRDSHHSTLLLSIAVEELSYLPLEITFPEFTISIKPKNHDPATLASLIKQWLRDLPDCVLTTAISKEMAAECVATPDAIVLISRLRECLKRVPDVNAAVFYYLLEFFMEIIKEPSNCMDHENLSTCLGVSLLCPPDERANPQSLVLYNGAMKSILEYGDYILASDTSWSEFKEREENTSENYSTSSMVEVETGESPEPPEQANESPVHTPQESGSPAQTPEAKAASPRSTSLDSPSRKRQHSQGNLVGPPPPQPGPTQEDHQAIVELAESNARELRFTKQDLKTALFRLEVSEKENRDLQQRIDTLLAEREEEDQTMYKNLRETNDLVLVLEAKEREIVEYRSVVNEHDEVVKKLEGDIDLLEHELGDLNDKLDESTLALDAYKAREPVMDVHSGLPTTQIPPINTTPETPNKTAARSGGSPGGLRALSPLSDASPTKDQVPSFGSHDGSVMMTEKEINDNLNTSHIQAMASELMAADRDASRYHIEASNLRRLLLKSKSVKTHWRWESDKLYHETKMKGLEWKRQAESANEKVQNLKERNAHLMSSNEELEQKTARVEADLTTLEQRFNTVMKDNLKLEAEITSLHSYRAIKEGDLAGAHARAAGSEAKLALMQRSKDRAETRLAKLDQEAPRHLEAASQHIETQAAAFAARLKAVEDKRVTDMAYLESTNRQLQNRLDRVSATQTPSRTPQQVTFTSPQAAVSQSTSASPGQPLFQSPFKPRYSDTTSPRRTEQNSIPDLSQQMLPTHAATDLRLGQSMVGRGMSETVPSTVLQKYSRSPSPRKEVIPIPESVIPQSPRQHNVDVIRQKIAKADHEIKLLKAARRQRKGHH